MSQVGKNYEIKEAMALSSCFFIFALTGLHERNQSSELMQVRS